jgi:hypothetical protein
VYECSECALLDSPHHRTQLTYTHHCTLYIPHHSYLEHGRGHCWWSEYVWLRELERDGLIVRHECPGTGTRSCANGHFQCAVLDGPCLAARLTLNHFMVDCMRCMRCPALPQLRLVGTDYSVLRTVRPRAPCYGLHDSDRRSLPCR